MRSSAGIPRRVNLVCNRLMLAGFLGEKHQLGAADVGAWRTRSRGSSGPETVTNPMAAVAPAARPATASLPVPIGQMRSTESDSAKLEERVTRLERLAALDGEPHAHAVERENQSKNSRKG